MHSARSSSHQLILVVAVVLCTSSFTSAALANPYGSAPLPTGEYFLIRNMSDRAMTVVTKLPEYQHQHYATLWYNRTMETTGWDTVDLETDSAVAELPSRDSYYHYAGFLEGYVTCDRIQNFADLMGGLVAEEHLPKEVTAWIHQHVDYMDAQIDQNRFSDPFWGAVSSSMEMLRGMTEGFNERMQEVDPNAKVLTTFDMFLLNFKDEVEDVVRAVLGDVWTHKMRLFDYSTLFIRYVAGDVLVGHNTGGSYSSMLRQVKTYRLEKTVSFTGYPGVITSGDNFALTSHNLIVASTTNAYFGLSLAKDHVHPWSVSAFLRFFASCMLAEDGMEWVKTYATNSSGTHSSQVAVLDGKLIDLENPDAELVDGVLWVIEELPGMSKSQDVTGYLRLGNHWIGANVPFFTRIFVESGFEAMESAYGPEFSYEGDARAQILARNTTLVTDMDHIKLMMRYNGYEFDKLSFITDRCGPSGNETCTPPNSPLLSIAARGDLVQENAVLPQGPWGPTLKRGQFGAIDSKLTSVKMLLEDQTLYAESGPTHSNGLAPFEFPADDPVLHYSVPRRFDFGWQSIHLAWREPPHAKHEKEDDTIQWGLIFGAYFGALAALILVLAVIRPFIPRVVLGHHETPPTSNNSMTALIR